ncbi:MAG: hypothetical protein M3O09_15995 [Acidobacteriota bacterium]|nr:hypothetical protein [Acidobacteriota bacterium]
MSSVTWENAAVNVAALLARSYASVTLRPLSTNLRLNPENTPRFDMDKTRSTTRKIFIRLSIARGTAIQIFGIGAAFLAFASSRSAGSTTVAILSLITDGSSFIFAAMR